MEYNLKIGGINIRVSSEICLRVEAALNPFMINAASKPDVEVKIIWEKGQIPIPETEMSGEDLLLEYFTQEGCYFCMAKGGWKGYLAAAICNTLFSKITCYINLRDYINPVDSMGNLLRFLPMRTILQQNGVMFFHAAQIEVQGVGILFTAPSGTGKTTQAKLWKQYREANIICNDRTLVREGMTYGYPVDGSEPVMSGEVHRFGAIILLEQDRRNEVKRLKAGAALAKLLPQMVFDTWNPKSRELAMLHILELLEKHPVYLLRCTPDEKAVVCLEKQLIKDGILK